jgi:hypothetical protein
MSSEKENDKPSKKPSLFEAVKTRIRKISGGNKKLEEKPKETEEIKKTARIFNKKELAEIKNYKECIEANFKIEEVSQSLKEYLEGETFKEYKEGLFKIKLKEKDDTSTLSDFVTTLGFSEKDPKAFFMTIFSKEFSEKHEKIKTACEDDSSKKIIVNYFFHVRQELLKLVFEDDALQAAFVEEAVELIKKDEELSNVSNAILDISAIGISSSQDEGLPNVSNASLDAPATRVSSGQSEEGSNGYTLADSTSKLDEIGCTTITTTTATTTTTTTAVARGGNFSNLKKGIAFNFGGKTKEKIDEEEEEEEETKKEEQTGNSLTPSGAGAT